MSHTNQGTTRLSNNFESFAEVEHQPALITSFVKRFCLFAKGDVVQVEPKGWSEAMGLEEHELEGWEGPTEGEVARDVAVEVSERSHDEAKLPNAEESYRRWMGFRREHRPIAFARTGGYSVSTSRPLHNELAQFHLSFRRRMTLCSSLLFPTVPDQAARVVVTWLNKAKEAEERRARTAAEPLVLDAEDGEDKGESSEEDDEDQDEFVYDIQVLVGRISVIFV